MGKWLGQIFCCSLLGQRENDDVVNGGEGEGKGRCVCVRYYTVQIIALRHW